MLGGLDRLEQFEQLEDGSERGRGGVTDGRNGERSCVKCSGLIGAWRGRVDGFQIDD